jgi:PEP-CTERM motif
MVGGLDWGHLALDPVDGTLWIGDGSYKLYQFSQLGTSLQSLLYSLSGGGWYGMEFYTALVPEPTTLALAAIGAVISIACAARKRRRHRLLPAPSH